MIYIYNDLFTRIKEITGLPVYKNHSVNKNVNNFITVDLIGTGKSYEEYSYNLEMIITRKSVVGEDKELELLKIQDKLNREFKFLNMSFCFPEGTYEVGSVLGSNFIDREIGSGEYIRSLMLTYSIRCNDNVFLEN